MYSKEKLDDRIEQQDNLVDLIRQFIKFVDRLREEGRITQEQYENLTKYKMEFLEHTNS